MADMGLFHGQRVELVEGEVLIMSPMNPPHALSVHLAAEVLRKAFGVKDWVRQQLPLDLGPTSEPEPDVSVVQGSHQQYKTLHPTTALLCVEVSDSSLAYDQGRKGSLYANHQVPDYWIVNLLDLQLEVYREPIADASQDYGWRYATVTIHKPGDFVSPVARPELHIAVADLFA
jgi:Uma2 family endonuclease